MTRLPKTLIRLMLVWMLAVCPVALAQVATSETPTLQSSQAPRLDELLTRGDQFENARQWQQAADVYERALRYYPKEDSLRLRWQKAERLFSLSRRYHDGSFTGELLELDESKTLGLYREILRKIETHYVKNVSFDDLVANGYRNLELALSEDLFVQSNFLVIPSPEMIDRLLQQLSRYSSRRVSSVAAALDEVEYAGSLCRQAGMTHSTPVILEFITAACEGLDPYSTHLSPNRLRDLYSMIDGNFVGLGIEVRGNAQGLEIVSVLEGSPAAERELKPGDLIVAVDGHGIAGIGAEEAANRLQGKVDTSVRLDVTRPNGEKAAFTVSRREVIVHSVTGTRILGKHEGIGYVRLNSFQKLTLGELQQAVAELRDKNMSSLIIDLRGNPGGLLDVALQVGNQFIDRGVLVSTRGRAWGQSFEHSARPIDSLWKFPLAVLIDGDSASASEIFAGAVKDHNRGVIVGTRSYGKGSVQSIFPLRSASTGLRLTTAYFYSPTGKVYQNQGVDPDIHVSRDLDAFGEEVPVPRDPSLETDPQLRAAYEQLTQSSRLDRQARR